MKAYLLLYEEHSENIKQCDDWKRDNKYRNEKCTSIIRKNKILYIQSMHDKTTIIKYKCSALT